MSTYKFQVTLPNNFHAEISVESGSLEDAMRMANFEGVVFESDFVCVNGVWQYNTELVCCVG